MLGFEVESRIGNAVYPAHYEAGWHITVDDGRVRRGRGHRQAAAALADSRWSGRSAWPRRRRPDIREMFGSMGKSFHPGRAAQNGYTAALLGRADFTAGERALEGPRGFAAVHGGRVRPRQGHCRAWRGLRSARERLQALRVRHRHASRRSTAASSCTASTTPRRSRSRPCACASRRSCSICATSSDLTRGAREQVLDLPRAPRSASSAARAASRNSPTRRSTIRRSSACGA